MSLSRNLSVNMTHSTHPNLCRPQTEREIMGHHSLVSHTHDTYTLVCLRNIHTLTDSTLTESNTKSTHTHTSTVNHKDFVP